MTPKIGNVTAGLMIASALLFDAAQALVSLIPLVGFIFAMLLDFTATFFFGIWFSHIGLSQIKRNPLGFFGTSLLEFIPFFDVLPAWTFFIATTIVRERARNNGL